MRARPLALARSIARARPSARRRAASRAPERATTMDARDGDGGGDVAKCLDATWTPLGLATRELRLKHTLPTGQSFRWRARGREDGREYVGVVGRRVVRVREVDDGERGEVEYKVYCRPRWESATDDRRVMREYFNADVSLERLYGEFAAKDGRFRALAAHVDGARMLRQDPSECLFSFICSSNNHISRIHGMVNKMCVHYGDALPVTTRDLEEDDDDGDENGGEETAAAAEAEKFYAFPSVAQILDGATEEELRALGFGYRAKFIVGSAAALGEAGDAVGSSPDEFLRALRDETPYVDAHAALMTLPGIGPKVSACVCLFSLNKHEAIPVDTHVWQFAVEHYMPELRDAKSVTPRVMRSIEVKMKEIFGPYCGWAHNALFIAELKHVRDALPAELRTPKRVATPRSTPKSKPNASKPSSKTAREAAAGVDAESDAVFDTPKKLKIDP